MPSDKTLAPQEHALPLALTMGDPNGIGPEIIAMACACGAADGCVVLGDLEVMRRAARQVGGMLPVVELEDIRDAADVPPDCIPLLPVAGLPAGLADMRQGCIDAQAGAAAAACIRAAAELALAGEVAGIVTAPIHKEALAAAGEPYPGHTEFLQDLAGGAPVRMMLANDELRTVLVTIHESLRTALAGVTYDAVLQTIRITHDGLRRMGLEHPRVAVAGLNPHAGEGGRFGDDELRIIGPAIQAACAEGIDARGPFAPDTVFMRARHAQGHPGEFDVVVAMYHDQGLIPVKYLGVEHGVNVTLGLPFVRTSPDHGTAFDLAGAGTASPASLIAAIRMARSLSADMSVGSSAPQP